MSRSVKLGDRVAVVNAAGVRVVGIYTIPWDGYLGYVMLQGGKKWAFAKDAVIALSNDAISQYPGETTDDTRDDNFTPASTRHYVGTRVNLRAHPELREECFAQIRQMLMAGTRPRKIAEIVGVSDKTVYNIKNSEKGLPQ